MQPVINQLHASGYHVQLRHTTKETSWEDLTQHGYVTLKDAAGTTLAHRDGFQHNRKLRAGGSWDGKAVEELVAEMTKALAANA